MLKKVLRRGGTVVVVLIVLAGAAYAVKTQLLDDDDDGGASSAPALRVQILPAGTYASSHPLAPYYVIPSKRFSDPSKLSHVARNKLVTKPESALSKGALAGSPQIVRLSLLATTGDPVTVDAVRATIVSDARPLRGWYTGLPNCKVTGVQRAKLKLDSRRARARYVSRDGTGSPTLALKVERTTPSIIELQASTSRHRVAWTAQLSVRDKHGHSSTVTVDDNGKPFRVTAARSARVFRPIYGIGGIVGYSRARSIASC